MKHLACIMLFALILSGPLAVNAQEADRFKVMVDATMALLPMRLTGTLDVGDRSEAIIDNKAIVSRPVYRHVDTMALAFNGIAHFGMNIPFYRAENWSIGTKLNLGFGIMRGIRAAEGINSLVFDFPEYLYYRNHGGSVDFSVLLGYKYSLAALPYGLPLLGLDVNLDDQSVIRIYGSPVRYKYYTLYTNGELVPLIRIAEIGIGYVLSF